LALFVIAFVLWPERGCVGDQPQHVRLFHGFRICHALRLTLRAQPRSANDAAPTGLGILLFLVSTKMPRRWCWKP
jgi:hypothetical protein